MKEFTINENENKVRYHDFPGEKTPILFIHGLGCAGSFDYPDVATQPELAGHRRILIDLLGNGYSDKPEDFSYTVEDHATYLFQLILELKLEKFILFAHSLGGAVALALADKCKEKLECIILSEANLDKSSPSSFSYKFGTCLEEDFVNGEFAEYLQEYEKESPMWVASLSNCYPKAVHRISKSAVVGASPSWRQIFYSLSCKKTFIFGEKSLPDEDETELKKHMVHIEIVPLAGHSMAWENPKGLAKAICNGISL